MRGTGQGIGVCELFHVFTNPEAPRTLQFGGFYGDFITGAID